MARGGFPRRSLLISVALHALPLLVLGGVVVHEAAEGRGDRTPRVVLSPSPLESAAHEPDVAATSDPQEVLLELPEPEPPAPRPLAEPVTLVPREAPSYETWRTEEIPLSVARRRIRPATPTPAAPAAPSRTADLSRGDRPLHLKPVYAPQHYPARAVRLGLQGRVRVEITVHRSGAVIDARVVTSSGHRLLDEAALASARQWRFAPIERTEQAVIPFRYER